MYDYYTCGYDEGCLCKDSLVWIVIWKVFEIVDLLTMLVYYHKSLTNISVCEMKWIWTETTVFFVITLQYLQECFLWESGW